MMRRWVFSMALLSASPASAQDQEVCADEAVELDGARLVRRMSLDLQNRLPTMREMRDEVAEDGSLLDGTVDRFMASDGFLQMVREHHADLLWPNLNQVQVVPNTQLLIPFDAGDGSQIWYAPIRSLFTRVVEGQGTLYPTCRNEPAEFDDQGRVILEPTFVEDAIVAYSEGYVEVTPYWAPDTTIKVCALDAQPDLVATVCPGPAERYPFAENSCRGATGVDPLLEEPFRGSQVACGSSLNILAPGCGCGANLRHCAPVPIIEQILQDLIEQQMRIVDRVVSEDRPYEEILTARELGWNGRLVHYLRYLAPTNGGLYPGNLEDYSLPDIEYTDESWYTTTRGTLHAGVLTSPGYLMRFAADRMRAHRYYNAFECRAFTPSGPLPSPFEPCSQREDLTERCGCDSCHITLEPLSAHWGRFAANGYGALNPIEFPRDFGGRCTFPFASVEDFQICTRVYNLNAMGDSAQYANMLNGYVFRSPDEYPILETGPRLRVESSVDRGVIQSCLAERMWAELMRREPDAIETAEVIPELIERFEAEGRSLKALVRAIVELAAYRRAE